jgi:hypothetical protein
MKFNEENDELERLHRLIKRKATGTPEQLAEKLGVCIGTVKNRLNILKGRDAPIAYCRDRQTYYYTDEVEITFFSVKAKEDLTKIRGGENNYNFFSPSQNFCLDPFDLCNRLTNHDKQNDASGFRFLGFGD